MGSFSQSSIREPHTKHDVLNGGTHGDDEWRLAPFQSWHAPTISRWVSTPQQLQWLAPSTPPPLTVEKVVGWLKPRGAAFVLVKGGESPPWGYGEINPMRADAGHVWLGHVIVRPDQRGRGLGSFLVRALLTEAFERRNVKRVALILFPDNLPALRCYWRAGFRVSGEEHHMFCGGKTTHRLLRLEIEQSTHRRRNWGSGTRDLEPVAKPFNPIPDP